jgi:hypothetical protein
VREMETSGWTGGMAAWVLGSKTADARIRRDPAGGGPSRLVEPC